MKLKQNQSIYLIYDSPWGGRPRIYTNYVLAENDEYLITKTTKEFVIGNRDPWYNEPINIYHDGTSYNRCEIQAIAKSEINQTWFVDFSKAKEAIAPKIDKIDEKFYCNINPHNRYDAIYKYIPEKYLTIKYMVRPRLKSPIPGSLFSNNEFLMQRTSDLTLCASKEKAMKILEKKPKGYGLYITAETKHNGTWFGKELYYINNRAKISETHKNSSIESVIDSFIGKLKSTHTTKNNKSFVIKEVPLRPRNIKTKLTEEEREELEKKEAE